MTRTGVLAKKIGMGSTFTSDGQRQVLTFFHVDNCTVVDKKTNDKNGYNAVVVGVGDVAEKKLSKPLKGYFAKNKVAPRKKLKEFRVSEKNLLNVGDELGVNHYKEGQYIDVIGTSMGKGFAGGMKRHGFAGLEATHGVSISHRSHGSTGQCQDPGRVFKGKKMAGHMGNTRVTVQNLRVFKVDEKSGLIMVKGSVPGAKNQYVVIRDAKKKTI